MTTNSVYRGDVSGILNVWGNDVPNIIGTQICPVRLVDRKTDYLWKRVAGQRLQAPDGTREPSARSKRSRAGLTQDTYLCHQHRLEAEIADEDKKQYAQWNIDWVNLRAMDKRNELLRAREKRWADKLFNTTTWPLSGTTGLSVSVPWATIASSTPVQDVATGMLAIYNKTGKWCDTLVLPNLSAVVNLSMSNQVRESVGLKYNQGQDTIAALPIPTLCTALHPALKRILVGGELYDSTPNASSATPTALWNTDNAMLCITSAGDDVTETCVGRTFAYSEEGGEFEADQYREEDIKSDIVGVQDCTDEKILLTEAAYLFGNID